ncbi:hypothetical protein AB4455_02980 [Vibrio sp. 10N.261.46.E12]|uniref:Uncharacterized protein n=1 Tax=Vibrio splendidus TaxID=29497 RepID=A0A2N7CL80_VIBSP|nr:MULTISPECIES: hypothetical protein [Vibrio]PMF35689.1 hypothetical protein BCV19_20355 [Vibrio splendidus]PML86109.1 hypothetical protein BCT66_14810 [Vibrio sp. 10N.261.49.E11]PMN75438.1 hypothetical protein BCT25_22355 [Vibrio sp. 10N.261.45.A6]PMN82334.1 hypothetical protein BCT22_13710 [Vibrio sp. 10N.261.45.A1]
MKQKACYLILLMSLFFTGAVSAANPKKVADGDGSIRVTMQTHGERFPASYTFNQQHQGQQHEGVLFTKERRNDGSIKTTPNGWSFMMNRIESDLVSLSVTLTEQEHSETFLFEVTPSNHVQCQSFPFNKQIVQSPIICLSKVDGI